MKAHWERWNDLIATLPAEKRPPETPQAKEVLDHIFHFAPAQAEFILSEPESLTRLLEHDQLNRDRNRSLYRKSWKLFLEKESGDPLKSLRLWKKREFFRIAARDLLRKTSVQQIMIELSTLASVCVQAALDIIWAQQAAKFPAPKTPFSVLGLGKLGGNELNYSSDIDLIYIYDEDGQVGRLSHHEWFGRLAQTLTQELSKKDVHGSLFRVDLRLRPEGSTGPIVHSLEGCENYYAAYGETWERLALSKARGIAGDEELAYEFCQRLQPFIYPRSISPTVVDEVYQVKKRIEDEIVGQDALDRHVKLGRGGIREIEFIAQTLQLLHGAKHPFLQETSTLKSLPALQRLNLLSPEALEELVSAYCCFRMVEHRLQMRYDLQTHTLPPDWETSTNFYESLGYPSVDAFVLELKSHQHEVRNIFSTLLESDRAKTAPSILDWPEKPTPSVLSELKTCGLIDAEGAFKALRGLAHGPEFVHTSSRTRQHFNRLWPIIRDRLPKQARPDLCLKQLERFIEAYGIRSALFELMLRQPKLIEILFLIFDNSRYLTDTIIRHPEFIEDIALTGTLDYQKAPEEVLREIQTLIDSKMPIEKILRLTKRSELLRIELRAMMGKTSLDTTMQEWSELAEVCLQVGIKHFGFENDLAIIAMGKFAGKELSNGSDLDIIFIGQEPRQATKIIHLMTETTEDGIVFPIDTRLRPYGKDGLLAVPLETYRNYYTSKAQLWEKLALTRARPVAGNPEFGKSFQSLVVETIYQHSVNAKELAEIFEMRRRIETERSTHNPRFHADYKTGRGGLVDLEFMTQISQLLKGWQDPAWQIANTKHLLELGGWNKLAEHYLFLRKMEFSLRRFHLTEESSIPNDAENQAILARHMGFANFDEFLKVYESVLEDNRKAFDAFRESALKS